MKQLAIMLLLVLVIGCGPESKQPTVKNGLLLQPRTFQLPGITQPGITQRVSFAVRPGENTMTLHPTNVYVDSGSVRFCGSDGFVEFRTNTHTVVWTKAIDTNVLSQAVHAGNGWQDLLVHVSKPPFVVSLNWAGRSPSLHNVGYRYEDLCFKLEEIDQGSINRVTFTIETSTNFSGCFGGWTLLSNWK